MKGKWIGLVFMLLLTPIISQDIMGEEGKQETVRVIGGEGPSALKIIVGRDESGMIAGADSLADAYRKAGDFDRAIAQYRQLIDKYLPKSTLDDAALNSLTVTYMRRIALCYQRKGDAESALKEYEGIVALARANRLNDVESSALLAMARCALSSGRYTRAVAAYEKILEETHYPEDWFLISLGDLYRAQGKRQEAERIYRQVIENHIDSYQDDQLALSFYIPIAPERWEELEGYLDPYPSDRIPETCRQLVSEGDATDEEAGLLLAAHYWSQGQYAQAREILQALSRTMQNLLLDLQIAVSFIGERRFNQAISALGQVRLDGIGEEKRPVLLLELADAYYLAGDYASARGVYNRIISHYPDSPQADEVRIRMEMMDRIGI